MAQGFPCVNLLLRGFVVFGNFVPIDDVPESLQVISALVLVFQIIRVLPNVASENRFVSFHERIVLVGSFRDLELAGLVDNQPRPSAAELPDTCRLEFLLESIEAAKGGIDFLSQFAGRSATGFWAKDWTIPTRTRGSTL